MRIVFKVIAIIGVLSFLGGLKNGEFFFFGLILAGIFGYFGWRPEKKMEKEDSSSPTELPKKTTKTAAYNNIKSSNKYSAIKQKIKSNNEFSETELAKQIESYNQKKELLIRSYNDGLFNSQEYHHKKSELEAEILKFSQLLTLKLSTEKVLNENEELFDRLLELKEKELITNDEYKFKYNELMSSLLQTRELQNETVKNVRNQDINDSDKLVHEEIAKDKRKTYSLLGFALILILPVTILVFQYLSNTSNTRSRDKSNKVIESDRKNPLDRIYLGTNKFHDGSGGTWGRATISKQGDHYWIKGEHKMSNGDWVKIEGKILDPTLDRFTFHGKISAYSPSKSKMNYGQEIDYETGKIHTTLIDEPDTCVWVGFTQTLKILTGGKYWIIVAHDCYSYTNNIHIYHN